MRYVKASSHRRCYDRFKVDGSATLIRDMQEVPSILTDLSCRGGGIVSNAPVGINEKVGVVINAPFFFPEPVYRDATVAWCSRISDKLWQAGLDFGYDNPIPLA